MGIPLGGRAWVAEGSEMTGVGSLLAWVEAARTEGGGVAFCRTKAIAKG